MLVVVKEQQSLKNLKVVVRSETLLPRLSGYVCVSGCVNKVFYQNAFISAGETLNFYCLFF